MENLVGDFWLDKRVLVTGHTGFKGGWLALVLQRLGAKVCGVSLEPEEESLFVAASVEQGLAEHHIADIRDRPVLRKIFSSFEPEVIFHLAAQPLVRYSYANPHETYEVNVIGTLNVLDMCREFSEKIKSVVAVTTDKCYENKEQIWPYRETDPMGGFDPYSSSKGCCEILISSYRNSFFNSDDMPGVASARAGNVIGGGDWSDDRLMPDIVRAKINDNRLSIRNPHAVRPWQHVLEPLAGYLTLAERLFEPGDFYASGWNFGPAATDICSVIDVVERVNKAWNFSSDFVQLEPADLHEAHLLSLDCTKALTYLDWQSKLNLDKCIQWITEWYKTSADNKCVKEITLKQIDEYFSL
jgi:CDP-glucose 4,6-dehydratase